MHRVAEGLTRRWWSLRSKNIENRRCVSIRTTSGRTICSSRVFSTASNPDNNSGIIHHHRNRYTHGDHSEVTGLFGNPVFVSAGGFHRATERALATARRLVAEISNMATCPTVEIVVKMDELSDVLCWVADLSECIRLVHPDPAIRQAAQTASVQINSYVEELNTDVALHHSLNCFMTSEEFTVADQVTQRTTELLMHDFEASGIHLDTEKREKVVELNNRILELSHHFMQNTSQPTLVHRDDCPTSFQNHFSLSPDGQHVIVDHVPYFSQDAGLRCWSYRHYFADLPAQRAVLEEILYVRQQASEIAGFPSHAHKVLKICMVRTPETALEFLKQLSDKIFPLAVEDIEQMQRYLPNKTQTLQPWDVPLCTSEARKKLFPVTNSELCQYFSLNNVFRGLKNLFQSLFGVTMDAIPTKTGEVWDKEIVKFAFVHEKEGLLGYTYCDLFARPGKTITDCHFTIQGGRELRDESYQTPIITICCNIQQSGGHGDDVLISQHGVENLYHEMGHALHSMLGRSRYQNVTGTRCSTDFAEVPSTLMEYFLNDSRVLESFARHYQTGHPIPRSFLSTFQLAGKLFQAYDVQMQTVYAITDLLLHTKRSAPITDVVADVYRQFSPLEPSPGTTWLLRFNHLYGYGARYYSYLWARAMSCLIWRHCFKRDPFSRTSGERLRHMLQFGGGLSPDILVRDLLTFEPRVSDLVEVLYTDITEHRSRLEQFINQ